MTTTPLTPDETAILTGYARGQSITALAKALDLPMATVSAAVMERAGLDRGRARELVATASGQPQRIPPRPVASPTFRTPDPSPPAADRPLGERVQRPAPVVLTRPPTVAPAPVPVVPVLVSVPRSTVEAVLAAGEAHGQATIRKLAGRARALITDLESRLVEVEREARAAEASRRAREDAAARLKELETEMATVKATLRGGRPEATLVRAWARENDVPCPDRGVVPQTVVDAYEAAHTTH